MLSVAAAQLRVTLVLVRFTTVGVPGAVGGEVSGEPAVRTDTEAPNRSNPLPWASRACT